MLLRKNLLIIRYNFILNILFSKFIINRNNHRQDNCYTTSLVYKRTTEYIPDKESFGNKFHKNSQIMLYVFPWPGFPVFQAPKHYFFLFSRNLQHQIRSQERTSNLQNSNFAEGATFSRFSYLQLRGKVASGLYSFKPVGGETCAEEELRKAPVPKNLWPLKFLSSKCWSTIDLYFSSSIPLASCTIRTIRIKPNVFHQIYVWS